MQRYKKTPLEKLETKVHNLLIDTNITLNNHKVKVRNKIIFQYNDHILEYTKKRYHPSRKEDITEDTYTVTMPLNHENLNMLSSNMINPPKEIGFFVRMIEKAGNTEINKVIIGADINKLESSALYITKSLFDVFKRINQEELMDKSARTYNRLSPLVKHNFNIECKMNQSNRNYSLMLNEVLSSGEFTQEDLLPLIDKLEQGNANSIVIEKQIIKQVSWLIQTIQEIIDEPNMNKQKAKDLGNKYFNFKKSEITGEEHLLEMILSKYGKNTFFGVPELLYTKKYVQNSLGLPRCQFDIILINYLNDIEVVELKKSSQIVLEYEPNRNKFYPSKDLSIAIAQSERYISTFYKNNDNDFNIGGKTIRNFVNDELGGIIEIEICRPKALIIIGTKQTLVEDYDNLKDKIKVTEKNYYSNGLQAYSELKNAFKNINILTYSELLENARLRLGAQDN